MISWWICGVIFITAMFVISYKLNMEIIEDVIPIFVIYLLVYLAFSAFMYFPLDKELIAEEIHVGKQNIMSLKDSYYSKQDGSIGGGLLFFYGSSKTEDGFNYYTLIGNDVDGYLIKSLNGEDTHLFLDGGDEPYVNYIYADREYKWGTNWFVGGVVKPLKNDIENNVLIKTELHLPKDAVEVDYTVDLQ